MRSGFIESLLFYVSKWIHNSALWSLLLLQVSFSANIHAQEIIPVSHSPETVNLQVTTHLGDKQRFIDQDEISFLINLDHACYLYAFYLDAEDNLTQIMPGKAQAEHYFKPGLYIPFPSSNSAFSFIVQQPFGQDQLILFASDHNQFDFNAGNSHKSGTILSYSVAEISTIIKSASRKYFDETRLIIHTYKK